MWGKRFFVNEKPQAVSGKDNLFFCPRQGKECSTYSSIREGHRRESQDGAQLQHRKRSSKFGENCRRVQKGAAASDAELQFESVVWPLWDQQNELAWPLPLKNLLIPKGDCGKYLTDTNCTQLIDKFSTIWFQTIWSKILMLIPLYREKTRDSLGSFYRRKGRGHTNLVATY